MNWSFDTRPEAEEFEQKLKPLLDSHLKAIRCKYHNENTVSIELQDDIEKRHIEAVFEKMGIEI